MNEKCTCESSSASKEKKKNKNKPEPVLFFLLQKSFKLHKFKFIAPIVLRIFVKATVVPEQHAVLGKAV